MSAWFHNLLRRRAGPSGHATSAAHAAKMAALGEMAAGLAHEINTPLTVIQLASSQALELLSSEPHDIQGARELVRKIENTSVKIARIVKCMRAVSRLDDDIPTEASLDMLIEDTLALCENRLKTRGIEVSAEVLPEDFLLECHPTQLQQVLLNLLNNACDAVEPAERKWIRVRADVLESQVTIRVSDSGAGIPEKMRERIFEPFFTTKEAGKGTGLGLSLSKSMIEAQGATLTLDSASPCTEFVITFPEKGIKRAACRRLGRPA